MTYSGFALLIFATVGLSVTTHNLWHAIAEYRYMRRSSPRSEIRELIAAGIARQAMVFVLLALSFMAYAIWEVWLPVEDHPPSWAVMSLMLVTTALVAFQSVRELADRRRMEELLDNEQD